MQKGDTSFYKALLSRQHTFCLGYGSVLIVDPQCTVDLMRVVYK